MVDSRLIGKWIMFIRHPAIPSKGDIDLLGKSCQVQHVFQNFDKHIMLHVLDSEGEIIEVRIASGDQFFQVFDHWYQVVEWCNSHKQLIEEWEVMKYEQ